jgi:molybdate transport system substrate-binding protein
MIASRIALVVAALLLGCGGRGEVTVYAASSLTSALEEAANAYGEKTGTRVDLRFGGSGALSAEIEHGAPADIFISADIEWFDYLKERDILATESQAMLGWNQLVVIVPNSATASVPKSHLGLTILDRIAVGDPESVPVGRYAIQALRKLGAYEMIQDRLVLTQDARAALALVERKEADGGVVYASDALASDLVQIAFEIEEKTHDPIVYPAAVVTDSAHPEAARDFLNFLAGPEVRRILTKHGLGGSGAGN